MKKIVKIVMLLLATCITSASFGQLQIPNEYEFETLTQWEKKFYPNGIRKGGLLQDCDQYNSILDENWLRFASLYNLMKQNEQQPLTIPTPYGNTLFPKNGYQLPFSSPVGDTLQKPAKVVSKSTSNAQATGGNVTNNIFMVDTIRQLQPKEPVTLKKRNKFLSLGAQAAEDFGMGSVGLRSTKFFSGVSESDSSSIAGGGGAYLNFGLAEDSLGVTLPVGISADGIGSLKVGDKLRIYLGGEVGFRANISIKRYSEVTNLESSSNTVFNDPVNGNASINQTNNTSVLQSGHEAATPTFQALWVGKIGVGLDKAYIAALLGNRLGLEVAFKQFRAQIFTGNQGARASVFFNF